ncbi:MAG: hypothetical protein AAGE84_06790 [Cyanobacteria bacterium P01_G01_bin.39]
MTVDNNSKSEETNCIDDDLDHLLKELNNEPPVELDWPDVDLGKLLEEIPSTNLEHNFDCLETDLSSLMQDLKPEWLDLEPITKTEQMPRSAPDPNLTVKDVAAWMLSQVKSNRQLYQNYAASYIEEHFGEHFTYLNENQNPAISKKVLEKFRNISQTTVVWNRAEFYWRLRQPSDPINYRQVSN